MIIDFFKKILPYSPAKKIHGRKWVLDICHFLYFKTAPIYKPMGLWVSPPREHSERD